MEAVYVNAGNSSSGNPRRGWVIVESGEWVDFVDEGYVGMPALRSKYPELEAFSQLLITPVQYRELLKRAV